MIDCGVHQIDLARWWTGSEVTRFSGHGTCIDDDHACPDHVYVHMTHANGVHSMIEASFSYGHTCQDQQVQYLFEAIGTEGVIRFNRDTHSFTLAQPSGTLNFPSKPRRTSRRCTNSSAGRSRPAMPGTSPPGGMVSSPRVLPGTR